jgi:signal transduction histidine kinase
MNGEIAEVVHELNNVLTGILVSSGLLEQRLEHDSPLRRYAAGIREGGENGVRLIRELQAHSRIQKPGRWRKMAEPRKYQKDQEDVYANHMQP